MSRNIHKRLIYHGQVQGVGFRYTVMQIVRDYKVTGYVQNLSDGSVGLEAEGSASEVVSFLDEVEDRMTDFVRDITEEDFPYTGRFSHFKVRY